MKRISTIFTATILLCLIIVVSISSVVTTNASKKAIEQESQFRLESTATFAADKIEKELIVFKSQIDTLVTSIEEHYQTLNGSLDDKAHHILNDYDEIINRVNTNNQDAVATYITFNYLEIPYEKDLSYPYQVLYVKDEKGNNVDDILLAGQEDFSSKAPYMAWFYRPIQKREGIWSEVYSDEFVSDTIVTYSAPVIVDGKVIAVVGIDIKFDNFSKIVSEIEIYDSGYAFLMNEHFDYLVHPRFTSQDNLATVDDSSYAYMINLFRNEEDGIIKYEFYGKNKIMAYTRLENNWIVAVAPPFDEVFYFFNELKRQQNRYIATGIILSIFIAIILGFFISRPLSKVAQYIEDTDTKELSAITHDGKSHFIYEVNMLYKNFTSMANRLNAAFEEIQHHNKNLEILIESRTKDLNLTNAQLNHYIEELENTQDFLVAAKLDQEINTLIKNIAHNMNTPLGNAITTYSYLQQQLQTSEQPMNIQLSVNIVDNCLNMMKNIIDSLNILTLDFDELKLSQVPIKTAVESRFELIKNQNKQVTFTSDFDIDTDIVLNANKNMLMRLVDTLMQYCLISNESISQVTYRIRVKHVEDGHLIRFEDGITNYKDVAPIFYNNDFSQVNLSSFDINLHLLHIIISRGLSSHIILRENQNKTLIWEIKLPNK